MSTLETQYREYLRNNRGGFCSFEEWKEIHGNQIKQALIEMMEKDEELGLYNDTEINRIKLVCKDCSDSLEDCTCIVSTIDFPRQETFEDYLQRLKDRRTEDDYKYTDEDFKNRIHYIFDCYEKDLSVYKCLEFMYFAEKEIQPEQIWNEEKKKGIKQLIQDHKKETLEQAAERLFPNKMEEYDIFLMGATWQKDQYTIEEQHIERSLGELEKAYIKGFNEGAAWKAERMYSEEEVIEILLNFRGENPRYIEDWFNQFKKQKS